jgi:L-ribulose-5-phosphate 4-epimerase
MTGPPYTELRERVCEVNRALFRAGLVVLAFGNVSAVDRGAGIVAIKPSGMKYVNLRPADIVVVALDDGAVLDGDRRPSTDTPAHAELYRAFPAIGGVVHTHSAHATAWAQAGREIPCLGTTHADHFRGAVPISRPLTRAQLGAEYERETGLAIVDRFVSGGIDPQEVPACLAVSHGPFTWGPSPEAALENAIALEHVAEIAIHALAIDQGAEPLDPDLRDRHHARKHGRSAYYGQPADPVSEE